MVVVSPLSLGTHGTINDGAKHKRMSELRSLLIMTDKFEALKSSIFDKEKRTAVAASPFFTQSEAAVVVVLVRCLVLIQGRGRSWEQVASSHAVNCRTCCSRAARSCVAVDAYKRVWSFVSPISESLRYGYHLPLFGFGTSPLLVARFLCPVHLVIGWTNKLRLANGN